ncbi:MAG: dephospho-CoA kinase, partial [Oscillospiraceae bacterium]
FHRKIGISRCEMLTLSENRIIGLTGMSGAGKSTVARVFADNGFTVVDCDECAREAAACKGFLDELARRFTPEVIDPDGTLNRRKTAALIFAKAENKARYERIIYPYITHIIIERVRAARGDVLLDAPTLFEARLDWLCDSIVSVCAEKQACARRICARDGLDPEQAAARLSAQHDAAFFRERSDRCIENNGSREELAAAAEQAAAALKGRK